MLRTAAHAELSSHAYCWQVQHSDFGEGVMFSLSLLDEGGATVTGGEAVWDVFVFQNLLQRYPVIEASVAGQGMTVEASSTTSLCTSVETQDL